MDLDNIKLKWNKIDVEPTVSEDKIRQMVDNKGQSALGKLMKLEKIFLGLLIPCLVAPFLHNIIFPTVQYSKSLTIVFILFCIVGVLWQIYKINHLRKVDLLNSDLVTNSKLVLRYRTFIIYEFIGGIIFFFSFMILFSMNAMEGIPPKEHNIFIVFSAINILVCASIIVFIYFKTYRKYIKELQKSVKKEKEFEIN